MIKKNATKDVKSENVIKITKENIVIFKTKYIFQKEHRNII